MAAVSLHPHMEDSTEPSKFSCLFLQGHKSHSQKPLPRGLITFQSLHLIAPGWVLRIGTRIWRRDRIAQSIRNLRWMNLEEISEEAKEAA